MNNTNFDLDDIVLVYEDTPTFEKGAICQIIDRDPNDGSFAVADIRDMAVAQYNLTKILNRYSKWVKPEHMIKLEFKKPKSNKLVSILPYLLCAAASSLIVVGLMKLLEI